MAAFGLVRFFAFDRASLRSENLGQFHSGGIDSDLGGLLLETRRFETFFEDFSLVCNLRGRLRTR